MHNMIIMASYLFLPSPPKTFSKQHKNDGPLLSRKGKKALYYTSGQIF